MFEKKKKHEVKLFSYRIVIPKTLLLFPAGRRFIRFVIITARGSYSSILRCLE